ncbi:hypothetical protein, partial [Azospirillum rugosum]
MSLRDLLVQREVTRALIVDDALDTVPLAADLDNYADEWSTFAADLNDHQRELINRAWPDGKGFRFTEKIVQNEYVAAIWRLRDELGEVAKALFARYVANHANDLAHVDVAHRRLKEFGLKCTLRGRSFSTEAQATDLIVIDLYLGGAQNQQAFNLSKELLREAVAKRAANPPLVLLISRSSYLEANRDEFRDSVGLTDSGFRILPKQDLDVPGRLERQLERLATNAEETRKLARFFHSLETGIAQAAARTVKGMRRLKLSDIAQVQQLLLEFEGEPTGSYLVDVFDRVLQHEIEAEKGIINSALELNGIKSINHPPPYVAGSPELQDLVQRILSQNPERLRLKSSPEWPVSFGDILRVAAPAVDVPVDKESERTKPFPVEVGLNEVLLVLTPACDLQRGAAPRVLLLVGDVHPVDRTAWKYGSDSRTPAIMLDGQLSWIAWRMKHIDTVSWHDLRLALAHGTVRIVARLREAPALEIQQRLLSGLGRVGLIAPLPATFPVSIEAYVPNALTHSEGAGSRLSLAKMVSA